MRRIYKYQLETTDLQIIKVPALVGAKSFKDQVLSIDVQNGNLCIWCLVDVEEEEREINIRIIGTGDIMPLLSKKDYLGSYVLYDGKLVFHVFVDY